MGAAAGAGLALIFLGLVLIVIAFCTVLVSISSFVIAGQNWNVTCDDAAFMSLSLWLVIIAVLSLVCIVSAVIAYFFKHGNDGCKFYGVLLAVANSFVVPFFIMGCKILETSTCSGALWQITIASLVFQGIIMGVGAIVLLFILCGLCCSLAN
jgi:hypothetical protein